MEFPEWDTVSSNALCVLFKPYGIINQIIIVNVRGLDNYAEEYMEI